MFWNILKNDIARGIFKRKYLYIISTVVIAALVIIADMSLGRKTGSHGYTGQVSVGDLFQVFYRGSRIIKPDNMAEFYISETQLRRYPDSLTIAFAAAAAANSECSP